jgi:hypothetical protein
MVIYAAEIVHLEYYQTAQFGSLMTIVSFIIFIYTGYDSSILWRKLAEQILIQYALTYLLQEGMKAAEGDETKQALLIIAYVAASYKLGGGKFDLTKAEDLFKAVQVFNNAFATKLTADQELLQEEMDSFDLEVKAMDERLKEAQDLLGEDYGIDPLYISSVFLNDSYENPDAFYKRTAHQGNPGVLSLDYANEYVERSLRLPELGDYSLG